MSFQINTDQQRIEASGTKATGNWTNATYSRTAAGVGNIVSVAHGIIGTEKLYLDFTSGGEVDGEFTVTKVDDDNLSFVGSANSVITAGAGVSYKRVRSLSIQGDESLEISVGTGALEKDAIFVGKNAQENIRVGVNTTDPQYELDVEGQIRTTRSIISDTAQVTNLDIDTIINPALNLRAPNLVNFEDTDVTSPTFGTTFFPTADTPPLSDQSRRVATTDFVYQVATNDTGGRVYVSQTIGSDLNDGRSAARPVKTVKKAAQIAYGLQKATPDASDEYVTIIVSGGEYLEDNPISLPRNCSLVGDNLRRVIMRPANQDRHMIKASNETYIFGVVFRDALQNASDPQSTVIHTWKYAFVFDDKQRLYYEPEISQIPAVPGDKFRGDNIFKITFNNHTGSNTTMLVGHFVQGGSSGTQGQIQAINFTGPVASPYSTGDVTILITSGVNDVFQDAEKVFYDPVLNDIITDINNASVSDRFDVIDGESLRPELETISNQIYQHTVDTERETVPFRSQQNKIDTTLDRITITNHGFLTGQQVVYSKGRDTLPQPGLIDGTRYWIRKVDDNTIELYDTEANSLAATSITQGRKDLTGVREVGYFGNSKIHTLTTGDVMFEDNHIYVTNHQFATGDGIIYRQGKMGAIGGLVDGTAYFVYVESPNWFRLASSAANAVQKDASGNDDPVTLPLTSAGLGFQRFEYQNKTLSITTLDTSLNTVATYNGPIFNLATSASSSDFHDFEVGQEVNIYGFQNSSIDFGSGTNSSYSISGGLITVQITSVDNTKTSTLFSQWQSLGQAGITFNFPNADERFNKTYLIGNFSTGSGTPSLPGNSDLGLGYGRYNSSNTTITFVLKQSNIDTASDVSTSSGTGVSVLNNLEDLNGRKYITHRIERADGYSLQFVVRANISEISTSLNPTGDQSVIGSNNYVLASLRNSPYGFTKINQSDRFRDGAENIKNNQEFIAEEAVAYVKYYYESSLSRGTALTIGGTNFGQVAETVTRGVTSFSMVQATDTSSEFYANGGSVLVCKVDKGHNLYPNFSQHTPTNATYTATTGNLVVTVNGHGFSVGDLIKFDPGALVFRCSMDDYSTLHAYPRQGDPAANRWLKITSKTTNTFTVNVGTSPTVNHQVSNATYNPTTGLMELTIGAHSLKAGTSIKMPVGAVTFSCAFGGGGQVNKSYPRSDFINPGGQVTNAAYNPTTGIMTVTTTSAHGLQNGNKIQLEDDSFTFTCTHGSGNKTYPRSTDPLSGRNIPVFNVTTNTFDIQTLDVVPSTNTTPHTFVSATSTAVKKKKDAKIYDEAVKIESVTATTITVQTLENTPSTNTDVHTFVSAATNAVVSGGNYTHQFASAGTNSVKKSLTPVTISGMTGGAPFTSFNGTWGIRDIYSDTEFTLDIDGVDLPGTNIAYSSTIFPSGVTFTDLQQPFRTPNSPPVDNKYGDVSELLFGNADMIAEYAVNKMLAANGGYNIPTGNTACYDDVRDFIQKCVAHNLKWGGNDRVYDQAKFYIDPGFSLTRDRYAEVFGYAKDACILAGRNLPLYRNPYTTKLQYYHNATLDTGAGTVRRDAATLIQNNLDFIANEAVQRYEFDNPGHRIPGANQNCVDDALDVLRAVTYNLAYGGNEQVYDAANLYVGSTFLDGEETESRAVFALVNSIAKQVVESQTVTVEGNHGYAQVTDNTNKGTSVEANLVDGFFDIVDLAIANDNMSHATRTVATNPSCANVISSITTFFDTVTTAIGSGSTPGNVTGVARTSSPGDQQCIDDTMKILRAFQYDLRYGGNQKTVEAANLYISGASGVQHVATEVTYTRAIFAAAKELAIDAIRNNLEKGQFSQIVPRSNGSITVDSSAPECANVVSALTTNWGILDNVLSSGNAYTGTVTNPDPLIVEQDQSKYSFPLVNTFLDLPVIEASPYIQNSSLISFLGGSGCEIDGAKVATPNVPRPGLKQNAQGNTVAQFDPQGKSMVANAFTIICFGGTAYNVSNDGYTQLVSVFAIFCQDGILTQSGGYASVTNSASNFGTYALRSTGFRAEAYSFDIGVIDSITDDVDGNGVPTGRQVVQVSGTTLTGVPVEDYIIKIDGYTSSDPAVEHIILETEIISGAAGTQIVAKITTNRAMDFSQGGNRYQSVNDPSFVSGSLPLSNLVGATIRFHRPSVTNSSSHTWEYAGSGNTYAALPQNGGVGLGTAYEAAEEKFGQVYTSGTNEFGDFKVGNFVTIFNRTGAISFVGTVSISELSSIKIVGGDITITGFSKDDNLGGTFASDSLLPTQASVRDYISNNLGPYLNQPYSTNAVPSALVQLTSSGKINIDQIPALRPFNITSVASTVERLAIEDANAGDIAIETTATTFSVASSAFNTSNEQITIASHGVNTGDLLTYTAGSTAVQGLSTGVDYYAIKVDDNTIKLATTESNANSNQPINLQSQGAGTHQLKTQGTAISYILENDLESQFLAFPPNNAYQFTNGDIVVGSSTTARGVVQSYNDGTIFNFVISTAGDSYSGDFALTISAPNDTVNGVQAAATANVVNGSVTKVTITNGGKGYYTQPTVQAQVSSGTTAVIAAQIEGRVNIDIANNIKFDAGDFILDQANANEGTGTYSQSGTTITITENSHNLSNADLAYIDFTSGGAPDGFYTISLINANQYSVTAPASGTNSGNMARKRIIDLSRVINTSAQNAANWTQLTSTNIDASNIVAGTIDPERLAGKGTANSYTFLRGDSSWEYALQSVRPTTQDAMVIGGDLSDSSYIDSITITNGGTGYTNGTYQNIPMGGGNVSISSDSVARATYIVSGGTITSATVTDAGTGYTGNFSVTIPSELGGGVGAILNATKGTINRSFGNIEIDIRKGNNLTASTSVYGNYGVFRFRKDVTNQAIGNQDQGGFIIDNTGSVSIDQGPGSGLNADKLDGSDASFFQNAGSLIFGTLDPARLANTTYAISISGTADTANVIFNETASLTSNPSPAQAANGVGAALRNNNATGLNDGGSTHGIITYRREATGNAATQLGFTANNNLYIRGNSTGLAVYSNWFKIWSENNQGSSSGLDADKMDGKQGLWYQTGYNVGDTRGGINAPIGDMFLPEVLGQDKMVFENFYVNDTGNKFTLYIPDFHCNSGVGGNINNGGTYTIYSDVGATNNIGSIVVDSSGGVQEKTHTTGEIYSLVTGTIAFVGNNTNANIYVFGPNPGTKWTVTSSNKISGGSSTIFGLRDNANGAKLQIGKSSVSTTPTIDFRSSGQAPNYDVQFIISGGNSTDGNGAIRLNASDFTVKGNTVWHSGNDGISSQLDAHYLDGYVQSTSATGNTIARRDGSGHLTVNDLYGDQGIFSNNGTGTLSLADGNGITLGKSTTNTLAIKGKNNSNQGYIRFGNDSKYFGYTGTYLYYGTSSSNTTMVWRGENVGIGNQANNPSALLHLRSSTGNTELRIGAEGSNDPQIRFTGEGNGTTEGMLFRYDNSNGQFYFDQIWTGVPAATPAIRFRVDGAGTPIEGMHIRGDGGVTVKEVLRTEKQISSSIATGTAPISVNSQTVCPNLNADLLDGYTALSLPYLQGRVNVWITDDGGQERFYFSNNSHTYLRTGNDFYFRSNNDSGMGSINGDGGYWTLYGGSDQSQSTYRLEVRGSNGVNINTSSTGLSSGQRSVVLRAEGDKQWIDTYGVFKRNRNTVAENITVANGDNCMSAGPITINNGNTITVNNGGSWSIV